MRRRVAGDIGLTHLHRVRALAGSGRWRRVQVVPSSEYSTSVPGAVSIPVNDSVGSLVTPSETEAPVSFVKATPGAAGATLSTVTPSAPDTEAGTSSRIGGGRCHAADTVEQDRNRDAVASAGRNALSDGDAIGVDRHGAAGFRRAHEGGRRDAVVLSARDTPLSEAAADPASTAGRVE